MNTHLLVRKTHRYLGIIIGIQFLMWTISGLYFSWSDIDEIHGDHMRKSPGFLHADQSYASPTVSIGELKTKQRVDSIHSIQLISVAGKPVYQIAYFSGHTEGVHHHVYYILADALTGALRAPLTKEEAIFIARDNVHQNATLVKASYLEYTDGHHEYRERPLPAWAVSFDNPACTLYVSAERGTFQTIRHSNWRVFDFLWMGHTMDYESRDDINNLLLRLFSIFGLATVLSGFTLFFVSLRFKKAK
jgi:hypothetical protein